MIKYFIGFLFLMGLFGFASQAQATAYYVDFVNGSDVAAGTATTTAFQSLDAFTEVARSAGDIAFVRRGMASTTNVSDLNFTSSGTMVNPIIITADYDNLWSDFATSSQTYSLAVGSTTMTASAAQSDIEVGEWIYVAGDCFETYNSTAFNTCEFAYEVKAVASTSIDFYFPYKGNQTGSGNYLRILPSNPQWNTQQSFQWNFDNDNFWYVKGLNIYGNDSNGQIEIDTSKGSFFFNMIMTGNDSAGQSGIAMTDDYFEVYFYNSRCVNLRTACINTTGGAPLDTYGMIEVKNSFIDGSGGSAGGAFTSSIGAALIFVEESQFNGGPTAPFIINANIYFFTRNNAIYGSNSINSAGTPSRKNNGFYAEDYDGEIGKNLFLSSQAAITTLQSTTTVLRTGGGSKSIQVLPDANLSTSWELSHLKLFEYPIYTDTSSKQYDVYFYSTSTTAWTANPTKSQLWIECEFWNFPANGTSTRKITKSTGTLNFTGSTAWQNLSVTCQPTNTGILYLRGWYAKAKEANKMNEFFIDILPVIQ